MKKLSRKEARDYLNRWQLVDLVLEAELRETSAQDKFQKMDAAYRMAVGLGFLDKLKSLKRDTEDEVRRRWLRLQTTHP